MFQILNAFSYVSIGSVFIPIICYLLARRKSQVVKILFVLLAASLVSDVGNEIYVRAGFRGYLILNIFFVTQVSLLGQIYSLLLERKKLYFITLAFFLAFCIFSILFLHPINEYQCLLRLIASLLL